MSSLSGSGQRPVIKQRDAMLGANGVSCLASREQESRDLAEVAGGQNLVPVLLVQPEHVWEVLVRWDDLQAQETHFGPGLGVENHPHSQHFNKTRA